MKPLREQMVADMELKGYSPKTRAAYLRQMERFAKHYGRPPGQIDEPEIRNYLHYLLDERKLSDSSAP